MTVDTAYTVNVAGTTTVTVVRQKPTEITDVRKKPTIVVPTAAEERTIEVD
jgi:hypothetical protein